MGVKVAGQGASSFVSKEVALRKELARVLVLGLAELELFLHEENKELLGINLRHLHVTMRVTVEQELLGDTLGKEGEKSS